MILRRGKLSLPSKEIRKGARLISAAIVSHHERMLLAVIAFDDFVQMRGKNPNLLAVPRYVAVDPAEDRLVFFPLPDVDYDISQIWQLKYEVS